MRAKWEGDVLPILEASNGVERSTFQIRSFRFQKCSFLLSAPLEMTRLFNFEIFEDKADEESKASLVDSDCSRVDYVTVQLFLHRQGVI